MRRGRKPKPAGMFVIMIVLALSLPAAIACGGADQPQPPAASSSDSTASPEPSDSSPPASAQEPAPGEPADTTITYLVADWGGDATFDPTIGPGVADKKMHLFYHAFMINGGGGGELLPGVVKEWELSPDGRTWTFTAWEDGRVKAHNGEVLDQDDVWWKLERSFGQTAFEREELTEPDLAITKLTESVEKVGDNQVSITFQEPLLGFPFNRSQNQQGSDGVVLPADYLRQVREEAGGFQGYEEAPVGAGPMKIVDWQDGSYFELEYYEDFYHQPKYGFEEDKRVDFRRLRVELVPEAATRAAAMAAGEADIIEANLFMIDQIESSGGRVLYQPEAAFTHVIFVDCMIDSALWCSTENNGTKKRQAFEYATDREGLINALYNDDMTTIKGFMSWVPNALGYVPGVTDPWPYDPEKAKQLMDEAGCPLGSCLPKIDIWTWESGSLPLQPELAQAVCQQWMQVFTEWGPGCEVNVGTEQSVKKTWNERKLPGAILIRPNEARWNTISLAMGNYWDCNIAWRHSDGCHGDEVGVMLKDKFEELVLGATSIQEAEAGMKEFAKIARPYNHFYNLFIVNTPWGVSECIESWEMWPLVAYITAPANIKIADECR